MYANLKVAMLFAVLIGLFVLIGWVIGGMFFGDWVAGALFFLIIAAIINTISYFFSDRIVLWSYGAKIVGPDELPRVHNILNKICLKSGMPMPKLAIVRTQTPNAFATGRNQRSAVVAVTEGILNLLTDDELEGVLAHELAHIKDRDMLVMSVAATVAGAIAFASRYAWYASFGSRSRNNGNAILFLVVAITAPLAAMLIRLAISRSREYKADAEGAMMIQRPLALARALEKLEAGNRRRPLDRGSPTSASLFIVNPFRGEGFVTLFMTHPPISARVRRLEQLAERTGYIA